MNRLKSIFYTIENVIVLVVALLILFNIILALILKSGPMGWGVIAIIVNAFIGGLGLFCWLWRNFLKNNPFDSRIAQAFVFVINRYLLYYLMGLAFILNYDIPSTLKRAKNHRMELRKQRFENRFLCKYIQGEAPIEKGIWVYNYQPIRRYRRFEDIRFEVNCKDGKLHGMAREEHLNHGIQIDNYYTDGQLDSNLIFRREFRQEGQDTLIRITDNSFDYINLKHICQ